MDQNNVQDGTTVNFTITARSMGIDPITNLVVTDVLPDGLSFIYATVTQGNFTYPNWDIGTLTAGQQETLTLTVKAVMTNIYLANTTYTNTITNTQDQVDSNATADDANENITVNRIIPSHVITNRIITFRVNKT